MILRDARRGDAFTLLYLRTACQLRRVEPRIAHLVEALADLAEP